MGIYTISYSGTDCFLDQGLVLRAPEEKASYNEESGYIPSKVYDTLSRQNATANLCTTMNGCGAPYNCDNKDLPIRLWTIEATPDETNTLYSECNAAPSVIGAKGSATGESVEIIAIAGLAKMLGVTLHLVPAGKYESIIDYWDDSSSGSYTKEDLSCPPDNPKWNIKTPSTAGKYCLRWSKDDDAKIKEFLRDNKTVVLLGHSRGGVSCIIAANYVAEWFGELKIKILALDPVPGPGDWWSCLTHVPATKDMEYIGIYAIDEVSSFFNAVVPRVKGETSQSGECVIWDPLSADEESANNIKNWSRGSYKLFYTRGRHATIPGSRTVHGQSGNSNDDDVGASGNLVYAYVLDTLCGWGVSIPKMDNALIKQWRGQMNKPANWNKFKDMRNYTYSPASIDAKDNLSNALSYTEAMVGFFSPKWQLIPTIIKGFVDHFYYTNARGISSTSGRNPSAWNYLEAYIQQADSSSSDSLWKGKAPNAESYNRERGLVNAEVKKHYYDKFPKTGNSHVHRWKFLPDEFSANDSGLG